MEEIAKMLGKPPPHNNMKWSLEYEDTFDWSKEVSYEWLLGFLFIKRAGYRYEELWIKAKNDWNTGTNTYPVTTGEAYIRLKPFQSSNKLMLQTSKNDRSGNDNSKLSAGLSYNKNGTLKKAKK